ncbi:hypothetical protein ACVWZM_005627 [Bradyrhizobium sp. USDA 4501]
MLYRDKATPAEYSADLKETMKWLEYRENGTFVRMAQAGKDLFG